MDSDYEYYLKHFSSQASPEEPGRSEPSTQSSSDDNDYQYYLNAFSDKTEKKTFSPLEQLIAGTTEKKNVLGLPANRPMKGFWDYVFNPSEALPLVGGASTAYKKKVEPYIQAVHEGGENMMSTMGANTSSVPLNYISRIPAAAASTVADLGAGMVKGLPDLAVMQAAGSAARMANVWGGVKSIGVKIIPKALQFRGGYAPSSLEAAAQMDKAMLLSDQDAATAAQHLLYAGGTRKLTIPEQRWMNDLLERPGMREHLASLNAEEFPLNRAALAETGAKIPVPGRVNLETATALNKVGLSVDDIPQIRQYLKNPTPTLGKALDTLIEQPGANTVKQLGKEARTIAQQAAIPQNVIVGAKNLPEHIQGQIVSGMYPHDAATLMENIPENLSVSPKQFSDSAQQAAELAGKTKEGMIRSGLADPDQFARTNELNFSPIRYAATKIGIMPTARALMGGNKAFLKMRGDMLEEMRLGKGMIQEPSGPMYMTMLQEGRKTAVRDYMNTLSQLPEVSRPAIGHEAYFQEGEAAADGFVKMPVRENLGPLSGAMVKSEEASDILKMSRVDGPAMKVWKELFGSWRFMKTVLNPGTHINNGSSNIGLNHAKGLSPYRMDIYGQALMTNARQNNVYWQELKDGAADWVMGDNTQLKGDILGWRNAVMSGRSTNMYEAMARTVSNFITNNALSRKMGEAYSQSEALFKTAQYIYQRRKGVGVADAIKAGNEAIFNYNAVPETVKQVRSWGIPFITFTYKVAPAAMQAIIERPQVFAQYKMFQDSWNRLAAESSGMSQERFKQIMDSMPGGFFFLSPFRDSDGKNHLYNMARKTPVSDLMPGTGMFQGMAGIPANILLKNPLLQEAVSQMMGQDVNTGRIFAPPSGFMSDAEQASRSAGVAPQDIAEAKSFIPTLSGNMAHLGRTVLPEDFPGGGATQDILSAMRGAQNIYGERRSVPLAATESLIGRSLTPEAQQMRNELTALKLKNLARYFAKQRALQQGAATNANP